MRDLLFPLFSDAKGNLIESIYRILEEVIDKD